MTISKEARIGILATLAIIAVIWGYKFLKGEAIFDRSLTVNAQFDDVAQITKSSIVYFHGVAVGTVKDIVFRGPLGVQPTLIINIKQNPGIPKNAVAQLFSNGVLAGKAVNLRFDKLCSGADCAQNQDYIRGETLGALESMLGKPAELDPYVNKLTNGLISVYDTLKADIRDPDNEMGKSLRDIQATIISLRKTTAALDQMMTASSSSLNATMTNVSSITGNLKANNERISSLLTNVNDVTTKANTLNFAKMNDVTDGVNKNLEQLKTTLQETQNTVKGINSTLAKVQNGDGTVGQLVTNDSVYINLNSTLLHTNALMQDIRLNPKRYINLNPFRKYKNYVLPANDPLLDSLKRQSQFNKTQRKN